MKVLLACFLVFAVTALEEQEVKFQAFKLAHGKTYRNQAEETERFNIFKENVRAIEEHNALYAKGLTSYKKGINKFTDLTREEFRAQLALSSARKPHFNTSKYVKTGLAIPDSVDWRTAGQVTEVKDQGDCGACWAFSVTGATEAAYFRNSGKLVSLSEQQLIDCSDMDSGCSGGYLDWTFSYVENQGLQTEVSYPYNATDGDCNYDASQVVTKISDYTSIKSLDEEALRDAVANVGPVSGAMDASFLAEYESGIYWESWCSAYILNHAILIVGYGSEDGMDYWIVKNSWGSSFGEEGYFRIKRGTNTCGIAQDTVYPTI